METHLWTWSGHDFGNREGDAYDGRHVGHFHGTKVYAPDGRYLGELQHDDRLITRTAKQPRHRRAFTPLPDRPARPTFIGFDGFPMPKAGYEDFPDPDVLR